MKKICLIILFMATVRITTLKANPGQSFHYLVNANYSTQHIALDSLLHRIGNNYNEETRQEFSALKEWADSRNDEQLLLNLKVYEYKSMLLVDNRKTDSIAEAGLLEIINIKNNEMYKYIRTDALFALACHYFKHKKYALSMRYHYDAYLQYTTYSEEEFPDLMEYYYQYGRVYYFFKDFKKASVIYKEAWKAVPYKKARPGGATRMNTLALCYRSMAQYDSAIYYFTQAQKMAIENNEEVWEGILSGNVADVYSRQQRYDEAIPLITKNIEISKKYHQYGDLAQALAGMAEIYLRLNKIDKALEYQQSSLLYYGLKKSKDFHIRATLFPTYAKVLSANGKIKEAYLFLDSAKTAMDSVQKETNLMMISGVEEKIQLEKQQAELLQKENEIANEKKFRNILIGMVSITLIFLIIGFVQRNRIIRERKRSDQLLLNILPIEIAEELKVKGNSESRHFDNVTVLFTDFKGFVDITEKLSPRELVKELNDCFTAFDNIMQKHGLEKIKTIGDAYMAAGGLPTNNTTHAFDAVQAALEIKKFMMDHKSRKLQSNQPFFEIRIGIHTGPVIAGIVGVKKFTYDIWGDTVNTANRMESSGETGKVNISGSTYELVKGRFNCTYRGKISAKGKGEIDMYFVEEK